MPLRTLSAPDHLPVLIDVYAINRPAFGHVAQSSDRPHQSSWTD
jgi:hypothetical protein